MSISQHPDLWQVGVTACVRCPKCGGTAVIAWGMRKCADCLRRQSAGCVSNDNGNKENGR